MGTHHMANARTASTLRCAPAPRRAGTLLLAGLLAMSAAAGGCMRRSVEITSEPAGALVWVNDEELGRTPTAFDFKWYGRYDVRLVLEGHQPLLTSAEAVAPLHEYPGPDLVASAIPNHTRLKWHFVLTPEPADRAALEAAVVERARAARAAAQPPAEAPAGEAPSTEAKPADGKPAEATPADAKPAQ